MIHQKVSDAEPTVGVTDWGVDVAGWGVDGANWGVGAAARGSA